MIRFSIRTGLLLSVLAPAFSQTGDPTTVPGNVVWLDGSDPDGDGLAGGSLLSGTTWVDKSTTGGADAIQSVANRKPTVVAAAWNGNSIIRFDGGDFMDLNSGSFGMLNGVAGATLFAVVTTTSTSGQRVFMISNGTDSRKTRAGVNLFDGFGTSIAGSGDYGAAGRRLDSDSFQRIEGGDITLGALEQYAAVFDYAAGDLLLYVDGALETAASNFQSPGLTSPTSSLNIRVGADANLNQLHGFFTGDLAEIVAFDRVLSASERGTIEDYLRGKWTCQAPSTYCVTAPNSNGTGAMIGWSGSNSVAANDLVLEVTAASVNQPGIFFYGPNQTQLPLGDGFRCVAGQLFRLPVVFSDNVGSATYAIDLTSTTLPTGTIAPGESWNFQYWFRDPPGALAPYNLSNGLLVPFCQ